MNRRMKPTAPANGEGGPVYQILVTLQGIDPLVWRRLLVRGHMNLGMLHAIIQLSMGWTNSHLHQFEAEKQRYAADYTVAEDETVSMFPGTLPMIDETTVSFGQMVGSKKLPYTYLYDFGDSWEHTIEVEGLLPPSTTIAGFAHCIDGRRACPPEDCGGHPGYEELLRVISDPEDEEYESMIEWLGKKFDPDKFDVAKANKYLARIKGPDITDDQLARITIQRDGFGGS